jgi:serine/threonine protein kinase/Tol biopolymer transport system component
MSLPDRWKEISALYAEALERPESERGAFVADTCAGDAELRHQLESLLACHDEAQQGLTSAAADLLADAIAAESASLVGRQLGAYLIDAPLASGGMGEVYRATDTRLHRAVAVKILPPHVRRDETLRNRFEREAQAIAGLHHPHICVLHDIGHADGIDFLVMELLEGETLAERLAQGPLPLDTVLDCALQIADALIAIHRHGIVHRDLKPGNVMLTDAGAKLLDFGLAKVQGVATAVGADGPSPGGSLLAAGTSTAAGTLPYMTPEQLDRKEIDHRADIFAFGAVLYEMVTGRKAFDAADRAQVADSIREGHPAPLPADISRQLPGLDAVIQKCLSKSPADRWQDAGEMAVALRRLRPAPAPVGSRRIRVGQAMGVAAIALIVVTGAAWVLRRAAGDGLPLMVGEARPVTNADAIEFDPSLSPRGDYIAYSSGHASDFRLVVRRIEGGQPVPVETPPRSQQFQPRWSPDGERLLYITRDGVFVSALAGGAPSRIAATSDVPGTYSMVMAEGEWITAAAWSPRGDEIAVAHGGDLFAVTVQDGSRRRLAAMREEFHWCDWSPNGSWIACTLGNPHLGLRQQLVNIAPSAIVVVPAAGGTPIEIAPRTAVNQSPVWSGDGQRLYFVSNRHGTNDIYSVAIDDGGAAAGPVERLTTGLDAYSIAIAPDRETLAYTMLAARANLWSLDIPTSGSPVDITAARPVTTGNQVIEAMQVTPDGQWLLYDSNQYGKSDIFRIPIAGGAPERLTDHPADDFSPAISPDGTLLAFHSWRTESRDVFVQPIGGGPAQQLTSTPRGEGLPFWAGDRSVAYLDYEFEAGKPVGGIFAVHRDDAGNWGAPARLTLPGQPGPPAAMRDGRFVYPHVYNIEVARPGDRAGRVIYERSGPDAPHPQRVALDERETTVFFKAVDVVGRASFWSVPITGGQPRLLVRFDDLSRPSRRWDFTVAGGRFYFAIDERRSNIWIASITERRP